MEGMAELVLRASKILPGDLLIIGSVSGRSDQVVDLAITAKKYGCQVIAVTSLEYSSNVKSAHSSGLHLFEVADHVIDMGREGGEEGGNIIAVGTPSEIAKCRDSYTGEYLKTMLTK